MLCTAGNGKHVYKVHGCLSASAMRVNRYLQQYIVRLSQNFAVLDKGCGIIPCAS